MLLSNLQTESVVEVKEPSNPRAVVFLRVLRVIKLVDLLVVPWRVFIVRE